MRASLHGFRSYAAPALVGLVGISLAVAVVLIGGPRDDDTGYAGVAQQEEPTDESTGEGPDDGEDALDPADLGVRVTSYEVFLARDPFEPLLPETVATDPGSPTATPTGTPTSSPTGSPTTSPTGSPTTSPTGSPTTSPTGSPTTSPTGTPTTSPSPRPGDDGCVQDSATVCDGRAITLVDVYTDAEPTAVFRVDDQLYEVRAGQQFADHFRVLTIDPPCATWQYGDDRVTSCEGETVLK